MTYLLKLVTTLIALISASAFGSQADLLILIAKDAYDLRTDKIADQSVTQQSYKVKLEYPKLAISEHQVLMLGKQGWRECNSSAKSWEHFVDLASKPAKDIYQYSRKFANRNEFMVITMMYSLALDDNSSRSRKPENTVQGVYIIHYDLTSEEVRNQLIDVEGTCLKENRGGTNARKAHPVRRQ